jgi:hypothetical protein
MPIAHLSFRHFFTLLALFPLFSVAFYSFSRQFVSPFYAYPCMIIINAYCLSFLPSLSSPSRVYMCSLASSNKCLLPIFLSVTFLALLVLCPPIFTPHLNLACNDFNKWIVPIFLSVTFSPSRPFSALFPASFKAGLACF